MYFWLTGWWFRATTDFEILDHPVTNAEYCTRGSLKSFIELV